MKHETYDVTVTDSTVVLRRPGSSIPLVANVLGIEVDGAGKRRIWLDRTIHIGREHLLNDQWIGVGAVSTCLVET